MIRVEQSPGSPWCIIRVSGDLDATVVPELRSAVEEAVSTSCRTVVCDLADVTYMDSSALAFLVWADRHLGPVSGRLVLAGANPDVSRIIELSGLVGVVPSVSASGSVDDAVASVVLPVETAAPEMTTSFTFPADVSRMSSIRSRVADLVAPFGLAESAQFDLKVAVGEALANAVRHGSPRGTQDEVGVEVRVYADRVVVAVSDSGCGFSGEPREDRDLYASNGRGVLFMRALADFVEFGQTDAGGTCVQLSKRRQPAVASA